MAPNPPSPDRGTHPPVSLAASGRVAGSLRRARLTLLCGEAGAGRSSLLVEGLLPLLRRRASDAAARVNPRALPVVPPFPDRRARGRDSLAEMVVFVDDWHAPPLTRLHDGVDAALRAAGVDPEWHRERLTDRLESLASRFGTRFLFVLDGCDALLETPDNARVREPLIAELVRLLNLSVPAHLVIGLPLGGQALLTPLRQRLFGVPIEVLVLDGAEVRPIGLPRPPPRAAAPPSHAAGAAPGQLPTVVEVVSTHPRQSPLQRRHGVRLALALGALAVSGIAALVLWYPSAPAPVLAGDTAASAQDIAAAMPAMPAPGIAAAGDATDPGQPPMALVVKPALAPPAAPAVVPSEPAASSATDALPPLPGLTLRVAEDGAGLRLARELAAALALEGAAIRVVSTPAGAPGSAVPPALALVRYDALQAASRVRPRPAIGVIAPLYSEELQLVVRADSKIEFIHQIEGRRINIGAPQSARAITGQALYRQMFGRSLPLPPAGRLESSVALQRLAAGVGIDAVLLVAPGPADALAALAPDERRKLRLLALAPDHPASRRALRAYLPGVVREPGGAALPTLAAMTFLVVDGAPAADLSKQLEQVAASLCRGLPALQRDGDASWRTLRPGLQLETGWPLAAAAAAWRACGAPAATSATLATPATPTARRH